jgi:hypothetical protein
LPVATTGKPQAIGEMNQDIGGYIIGLATLVL